MTALPPPPAPRWTREDVQRVLVHVVGRYIDALETCGGDSELLRSSMFNVALPTLRDNDWMPAEFERYCNSYPYPKEIK